MFPNLRAEMARKRVTSHMLADAIGVNPATMSAKLNYPDRLKLMECKIIQAKFFPHLTIDELFATGEHEE